MHSILSLNREHDIVTACIDYENELISKQVTEKIIPEDILRMLLYKLTEAPYIIVVIYSQTQSKSALLSILQSQHTYYICLSILGYRLLLQQLFGKLL